MTRAAQNCGANSSPNFNPNSNTNSNPSPNSNTNLTLILTLFRTLTLALTLCFYRCTCHGREMNCCWCIFENYTKVTIFNSKLCDRPVEKRMGLIARYIEIAQGK